MKNLKKLGETLNSNKLKSIYGGQGDLHIGGANCYLSMSNCMSSYCNQSGGTCVSNDNTPCLSHPGGSHIPGFKCVKLTMI